MARLSIPVALVLVALLIGGACSNTTSECTVGADCASGVCESNGRCAPVSTTHHDGGVTVQPDAQVQDAQAGDAAEQETGTGGEGGIGCTPNHNGTITREEVPMFAGLHANFVIAENVTVDSAGTMNADGSRSWDFSGMLAGDHTVVTTTDAPQGQWFSQQFTTASYTTKLSDTSTLLGVFQATGQSLLLQGVVTPTSGAQQTEVSYMPAAEILGFPMTMGSSWTSTSTVTGTDQGVQVLYTEKYASTVDAHGTVKVPYGTFDVLRVQTTLTRTVGAVVTVTQSLAFIAECFGPVATLTSQSDETSTQFTNAAEAQRLTP
jgi:hypothetical protein